LISLLSASGIGPDFSIPAGSPPEARSPAKVPALTISRQVGIINAFGLHLRAADKFVRLAGQFRADVRITYGGHTASGVSILDLTTLAAACGSQLELKADGPDAKAALDALTDLIGRRFDEQA
jgi:phosphocarrier protein